MHTHNVHLIPAEEVLVFLGLIPLIFHGLMRKSLFVNLVRVTKIYLTLIYNVDQVGSFP
jgi:hypothetical protein